MTMTSAREWRLWIVAAIAGAYTLAWSQIAPPSAAPRRVTAAVAPAPRVAPRVAPTVRRVPASHPIRIRTRSS